MYNFEDIHQLQIEPTNFCNSFCGACARNIKGGELNPIVKLNHISIEDWQLIVSEKNLTNIKSIYFNGMFGDCCMHPQLIEFIKYLSNIKSSLDVKIMTNGGMRDESFWFNLAQSLKPFASHCVAFALDGLEDTLHIYRRNIDYKKVISNARTFINAGGYAEWRMILFDHNINQIEQSKNLSEQMGFGRFYVHNSYRQKINAVAYKNLPEQIITAPDRITVKKYQNKYNTEFFLMHEPVYENDFQTSCPWYNERWLQIDSKSNVWPCCFTAEENLKQGDWNIDYLTEIFGQNFNNIAHRSLQDILADDFYQIHIPKMWQTHSLCTGCDPSPYNFR